METAYLLLMNDDQETLLLLPMESMFKAKLAFDYARLQPGLTLMLGVKSETQDHIAETRRG